MRYKSYCLENDKRFDLITLGDMSISVNNDHGVLYNTTDIHALIGMVTTEHRDYKIHVVDIPPTDREGSPYELYEYLDVMADMNFTHSVSKAGLITLVNGTELSLEDSSIRIHYPNRIPKFNIYDATVDSCTQWVERLFKADLLFDFTKSPEFVRTATRKRMFNDTEANILKVVVDVIKHTRDFDPFHVAGRLATSDLSSGNQEAQKEHLQSFAALPKTLDEAMCTFWSTIRKEYPMITPENLSPETAHLLSRIINKAVDELIEKDPLAIKAS